jgi:DNA-binding GntR family transcriptional regulator
MSKPVLGRDSAYEIIIDLIIDGTLAPNQQVSERVLAEKTGIGRMPVREAIKDLARDGLLEVVPLRGTFVKSITLVELGELYEVRAALEGLAAYSAAQRRGSPELAAYREQFVAALEDQPDIDWRAVQLAGAEFHVAIFRAADNKLLLDIYHPIRMRFRVPMGLSQTYDPDWVRKSIDDHIEILDHIMAGRASEAQSKITEHLHESFLSKRRILTEFSRGSTPLNVIPPKSFKS